MHAASAPASAEFSRFAAAKVNLCLHVVGRRDDGYHLLDSVVTFAGIGDLLTALPDDRLSLSIGGPFGVSLPISSDNLVLRAARALANLVDRPLGARLHLEKRLPVASGIGGGSADAAATLQLLAEMWRLSPEMRAKLHRIALSLGADVPVCLASRPARMGGIGEQIEHIDLPPIPMVLVNPGQAVPTGPVFAALREARAGDWSPPLDPPRLSDARAVAAWLHETRNDLESSAASQFPIILTVLEALRATAGCLIARMSGSGATCFGIYATAEDAAACARQLQAYPWWVWSGTAGGTAPICS